ncbi:MAG: hypothetical protein FD172_3938 [Methylocystaceae bacterium]|nr:MAG: hypothetical protein FD172_3938 [Methylocystaceae bacterium]
MTKLRQNPAKGHTQAEGPSFEGRLEAIRLALLERPMARRGAFWITDDDLRGSRTPTKPPRVAAIR